MIKIVITNEKGGTGKSTIACLLIEYLNYKGYFVQLIDTDPLQTSQTWVNNCWAKSRQVSRSHQPDYQVIDTAGSSGSAYSWIRQADLVVVPLQMHYADLKVAIDWFQNQRDEIQKKVVFIPNRWQNTIEQREGAKQLQNMVQLLKQGQILVPLSNRAAVYGVVLNGSKDNFFQSLPKDKTKESQLVMSQILKIATKKAAS